jgi:hypothetical protein
MNLNFIEKRFYVANDETFIVDNGVYIEIGDFNRYFKRHEPAYQVGAVIVNRTKVKAVVNAYAKARILLTDNGFFILNWRKAENYKFVLILCSGKLGSIHYFAVGDLIFIMPYKNVPELYESGLDLNLDRKNFHELKDSILNFQTIEYAEKIYNGLQS